jgi:hypothetical protein
MRTALLRLVILAAALGAFAARADAPCMQDAAKLCPGVPAGDGRLRPCLLRNPFQLSSACQRELQELDRRVMEFNSDCSNDARSYCLGVQVGEGRVIDCLASHVGRRELSTNCEAAVSGALEKAEDFVQACATDAAALCEGVPAGGGRLFLCLRSQSDRLSSRCKSVVTR